MSDCKCKRYKPLYQGRIDGKCGPKTVAAIEQFQSENNIRVTGKVETYGQTINRLQQKAPSATSISHSCSPYTNNSDLKKIRTKASAEANRIKQTAPLPDQEVTALANFVTKAGDQGVLVTIQDILGTSDGRGMAILKVDGLTKPIKPEGLVLVDKLVKVSHQVSKWTFNRQDLLLKTTNWSSHFIKPGGSPSNNFLKIAGIQGYVFRYSITKSYLASLEIGLTELQKSNQFDPNLEKIILGAASKESEQLKSKLINTRQQSTNIAIQSLEGSISRIATEMVSLSKVRQWYIANTELEVGLIKELVKSGKIGLLDAEQRAHAVRGTLLEDARKMGTTFGAEYAKAMKSQNSSMNTLHEKYLTKHFNGKSIKELSSTERQSLAKIIIDKAGSPNAQATSKAKMYGRLGYGLWVLTFVVAAYEIYEAEDKWEESRRQASLIGGGIAGGATGGALLGVPLGPPGALAGAIIGGFLGALGAESLFNSLVD